MPQNAEKKKANTAVFEYLAAISFAILLLFGFYPLSAHATIDFTPDSPPSQKK